MLDEEGGSHHPHAIVHVTGLPEFSHAGIDQFVAGFPATPGTKLGLIVAPFKMIEIAAKIDYVKSWLLGKQTIGKFPPSQFGTKFSNAGGKPIIGFGCPGDFIQNALGTNLAESQMRRKMRREVEIGAIPIHFVGLQTVFEKMPQGAARAGFARLEAIKTL